MLADVFHSCSFVPIRGSSFVLNRNAPGDALSLVLRPATPCRRRSELRADRERSRIPLSATPDATILIDDKRRGPSVPNPERESRAKTKWEVRGHRPRGGDHHHGIDRKR